MDYINIGKGSNYSHEPRVTPAVIKAFLEGKDHEDKELLVSILLHIEFNAEHWLTDALKVKRYTELKKKVEGFGF